ncbi:hypothetical protein NVP1244A_142 [Vibrio phage 1.244.A._10N.261.54.C3]|nr:hypothetical protein NVP1244A_142 [Vibrio phage 1.244.A._10N.261.54.C3]AUR98770.1 hypothetical protein NVP1255O_142 [Vibrio phage 1.255.O._10N.286.45.F1]
MNITKIMQDVLAQRKALKILRDSLVYRAVLTNPTGFTVQTTKADISNSGLSKAKLGVLKEVLSKAPSSASVLYDSRHEWFVVWYRTPDEEVLLVFHDMPEYHQGYRSDSVRWLNFRSGNSPQSRAAIGVFKRNFKELTNKRAHLERSISAFDDTLLNM